MKIRLKKQVNPNLSEDLICWLTMLIYLCQNFPNWPPAYFIDLLAPAISSNILGWENVLHKASELTLIQNPRYEHEDGECTNFLKLISVIQNSPFSASMGQENTMIWTEPNNCTKLHCSILNGPKKLAKTYCIDNMWSVNS